MFFQFSKFWARSIQLASRLISAFRHQDAGHVPDLDTLRHRLDEASRRVVTYKQLVAGWREVVEGEQAAGQDASVAHDLLQTFQLKLEAALSDKQEAEQAHAHRLLDLFQGVKGHFPANEQELNAWLASPEGKAAIAFEPTSPSRRSDRSRS